MDLKKLSKKELENLQNEIFSLLNEDKSKYKLNTTFIHPKKMEPFKIIEIIDGFKYKIMIYKSNFMHVDWIVEESFVDISIPVTNEVFDKLIIKHSQYSEEIINFNELKYQEMDNFYIEKSEEYINLIEEYIPKEN
jgi:hypothetical protein